MLKLYYEDGTLSVDRIEYKSNVDNKNIGSYTVTITLKIVMKICVNQQSVAQRMLKAKQVIPINVLNDTIQIKVGEKQIYLGITAVDYLEEH